MRLIDQVAAVLDRRLDPNRAAPVALGLSGGGDSLALLHLAAAWTARRGRRLLALTVDHGLSPDSAGWSRVCREQARAVGADWRGLVWTGPKPTAGLPAAARRARHALLAEAARAEGAAVLLTAHTADDAAEGEAMRAEGVPIGRLREWAPSPVWPEGRDVFLLRPLLRTAREDLRAWLTARGLAWIEDPANRDPRRHRARVRLAGVGAPPAPPAFDPDLAELARRTTEAACALTLERTAFDAAPEAARRAWLSAALVCTGGGERPPRGAALDRLSARIAAGVPFAAGLCGARLDADPARLLITREASARPGAGPPTITLGPTEVTVWDGRLAVEALTKVVIAPARGLAARLDPADRARLNALPPAARGAVPVLLRDGRTRPVLAEPQARVRGLVAARLQAACGVFAHERDIDVSAHGAQGVGTLCSSSELSVSGFSPVEV